MLKFCKLAHCQWGSQLTLNCTNWQKCSSFQPTMASSSCPEDCISTKVSGNHNSFHDVTAKVTSHMTSLAMWRHELWCHRQSYIPPLCWSGHKNTVFFCCHDNMMVAMETGSVPVPDLPTKFDADRSVNGRGEDGQTDIQTLLVL